MKAVIIFEVKNKDDFIKQEQAHKLPNEKWFLLDSKYKIYDVIKDIMGENEPDI